MVINAHGPIIKPLTEFRYLSDVKENKQNMNQKTAVS